MSHEAGKGDSTRPLGVPRSEFNKNFESIFGSDEDRKKKLKVEPDEDDDGWLFDPENSPSLESTSADWVLRQLAVPSHYLSPLKPVPASKQSEPGLLYQALLRSSRKFGEWVAKYLDF